jgi:hypothetical protein
MGVSISTTFYTSPCVPLVPLFHHISTPNLMHNNCLHCYQYLIVSFCVPQHIAGVALSDKLSDNIL